MRRWGVGSAAAADVGGAGGRGAVGFGRIRRRTEKNVGGEDLIEGAAAAGPGNFVTTSTAVGSRIVVPSQSPSPRLLSAETRLAQEKAALEDALPQHCHAEVTSAGSDFEWSFRISGLHGTLYQVRFRPELHALASFPRPLPS